MKKDGSFDSLIYNDALFRNKQHVLNPKMINAPETWVSKFKNIFKDIGTYEKDVHPLFFKWKKCQNIIL